jgi:hypothetical protein
LGSAGLLMMAHRKPLLKITLGILGALLLVVAISAVSLFLDIRRTGCESGGQLLGPASANGYTISDPSQSGACFVSFVAIEDRDIEISRVVCSSGATFASCQALREEVSRGWTDLFGRKCTSVSFIGGADCNCIGTGEGCQRGAWPVQVIP